MSHISELVDEARTGVRHWPHCSAEQALVYSCETVASREHPGRRLDHDLTRALVSAVCLAEDVDIPRVHFGSLSSPRSQGSRCIAWADRSTHAIGFSGSSTDAHTVVHELAHLLSQSDLHDAAFRSLLIALSRSHVDVGHAALLRSLFHGVGLGLAPWATGRPAPEPRVGHPGPG